MLSIGIEHLDEPPRCIKVVECLIGFAQGKQRVGRSRVVQGNRVRASLCLCRGELLARIRKDGLGLVAHGGVICHDSTMAYLTGTLPRGGMKRIPGLL